MKKAWNRPVLQVLVRKKLGEVVLSYCKWDVGIEGPGNFNTSCHNIGCGMQDCSEVSSS